MRQCVFFVDLCELSICMAVFILSFILFSTKKQPVTFDMFICFSVGVYTVTVRASNLVSNESSAMEFIVEKPVTGLSINTSTEYVQVGSEVWFQAFISSGTNVHFDWSFGDLESAIDAGDVSVLWFCTFSC